MTPLTKILFITLPLAVTVLWDELTGGNKFVPKPIEEIDNDIKKTTDADNTSGKHGKEKRGRKNDGGSVQEKGTPPCGNKKEKPSAKKADSKEAKKVTKKRNEKGHFVKV